MTRKPTYLAVIGVLALTLPLSESFAADGKPQFSPNVAANIGKGAPKKLLWGDTHQHSGWSGDAGAFGAKLSPEDAVRFARGEEIVSSSGQAARLDRPLDFIVIADHSDGMGLIQEMRAGNPMTRAYAEARTRWEPLYEVTQIKGDSETHATLSPNDEFANFERWDKVNLNGVPKKDGQLQYEYARQALKNGMLMESRLGANPFKYGMIGSTDSHTGLSTPAENNYFSKHAGVEPKADRWSLSKHSTTGWQYQASGYAAVWAQDNTRGAIWDALKTKEVYGTTGSRIAVRVFGGFDFSASDVQRADFADVGYAKGVPMGGELKAAAKGQAPVLMIQAAKDPVGGNLDRVQVIKGWLDAKGAVQEKIYDVAWSGQRKAGKDGKLPSVGNTVNVKEATWSNSIGAPALQAVWRDPNFDPALKAFYYVRVIEIPTPRWTAYDAKRYGVTMGPEVPMIVTERAYTSPIWYNP